MKALMILFFACAALTLPAQTPAAKTPAPPILKIGVILPLSGDMAGYGDDARDTAELWLKDHPAAPVKLIYEDTQLDPVRSFNAAQKLINIDHIKALLTLDANTARPIKRLATQYKVIQICQAWDAGVADNKYNFIGEFEPPEDAAALCKYMSGHYKKIAILYMQNVAFSICAREVEKEARKDDLEVVTSDPFTPGVRDFRIELVKIKEKNPDVLVLLSFSPEMEIIGHQLKQLGWQAPLTSVNSFDQSSEHSLWNGCVSVSGMDLKGEYATKFFALYHRQTVYPGFTYDYLTLLNDAYAKAGYSAERMHEELQKETPFHGIVGDAINDKGTFRYQPYLVKMVDGMPQRMQN